MYLAGGGITGSGKYENIKHTPPPKEPTPWVGVVGGCRGFVRRQVCALTTGATIHIMQSLRDKDSLEKGLENTGWGAGTALGTSLLVTVVLVVRANFCRKCSPSCCEVNSRPIQMCKEVTLQVGAGVTSSCVTHIIEYKMPTKFEVIISVVVGAVLGIISALFYCFDQTCVQPPLRVGGGRANNQSTTERFIKSHDQGKNQRRRSFSPSSMESFTSNTQDPLSANKGEEGI